MAAIAASQIAAAHNITNPHPGNSLASQSCSGTAVAAIGRSYNSGVVVAATCCDFVECLGNRVVGSRGQTQDNSVGATVFSCDAVIKRSRDAELQIRRKPRSRSPSAPTKSGMMLLL